MKVIPPLSITSSNLTSSTAGEPLAPSAYAGGTTYGFGDLVSVAADFTIYESLAAGNVGHTPNISPLWWGIVGKTETAYVAGTTYALGDTVSYLSHIYQSLSAGNVGNTPLLSPTKWEDIGATNKWRMFDTLRNTATTNASPLTVVITPGTRIDSIAALGVIADSMTVSVVSGSTTVYTSTQNLITRTTFDWYTYFFTQFKTKSAIALFDLPPYTDAVITVTFARASGNVKCGALVLGMAETIGKTRFGAENSALNFSTVERDTYGNSVLIPRRTVPKVNLSIWAESAKVNEIVDLRTRLNAVPAVWSRLDDSDQDYFQPLLILGYYRDLTINMAYGENSLVTAELEEV